MCTNEPCHLNTEQSSTFWKFLLGQICSTDLAGGGFGQLWRPSDQIPNSRLILTWEVCWEWLPDVSACTLKVPHVCIVSVCGIITYRSVRHLVFKRFPPALLLSHTPTQSQFTTGCLCAIYHSHSVYTCAEVDLMFFLFGQNPRDVN